MSAQKAEINNNNNDQFLIAEYSALSDYFNTIINFRMIVFGLFFTSISVLLSIDLNNLLKPIIVFILTLLIWFLELRNRSISAYLTERGSEIENRISWKDVCVPGKAFFHRMHCGKEEPEEIKTILFRFDNIKIELPEIKKPPKCLRPSKDFYLITHTFVFDVTYSVILVISFLSIIFQLIIPMVKWILFGFA